MTQEDLFSAALGLQQPWFIEKVDFVSPPSGGIRQLYITINFKRGVKFTVNNEELPVYDHVQRTWRHLNFFQHECYIVASVPRVKTSSGNTLQVETPWGRAGSSFTLLFEAFALSLVQCSMSLKEAGKVMGVDSRVVGRIIQFFVSKAMIDQPLDPVETMSVDETSVKRGHNYITILTDVDRRKVVGVALGKDARAFGEALNQMERRSAPSKAIKHVALDLSPAYTSAVLDLLPQAELVYDRFHIEQMLSKAVDHVRRLEYDENKLLRRSKYLWLRNESKLTASQKNKIHYLQQAFPTLGQAYRLKELFKEIYNNNEPENAKEAMLMWLEMANQSKIIPIMHFCSSIKAHWSGIVTYFEKRLTSAFAERVNLKIQEIKRSARGYRNMTNFSIMIYFHLGKLNLNTHN